MIQQVKSVQLALAMVTSVVAPRFDDVRALSPEVSFTRTQILACVDLAIIEVLHEFSDR